MQCPACQSRLLRVGVSFNGAVSCQFGEGNQFRLLEKVSLNSDFPDEASCRCLSCHWDGQVRDIRIDDAKGNRRPLIAAKRPGGSLLSEEELEQITELANAFGAEPKKVTNRLVREVRRLHSLLDSVNRVSKSAEAGDTQIG